MDINRVITVIRNLKEGAPTNNTGSNGSTAGFSGAATGAMTGYDKLLHEPILDQDYQTPAGLPYRLSNVFPAYKLGETDIDDMVDASKEYMNISDKSNNDSRLDRLIDMVRSIREEVAVPPANNASSGAIAGLPPDSPPVFKKKRKPTPVGRYGSRKLWLQDLRKDGK
jgi:hypothetical protein|tara:strand:- start:94 stop:597 length:504 start_codon:yes stop_codon:yes gene_type:complete